ncbi:hypothetical protein GTO27_10930, partial [Candidatus Bathyarchaeota archaeon]|nr:hypothetical protein [Candidatus Bathyarchaeota archaeon]
TSPPTGPRTAGMDDAHLATYPKLVTLEFTCLSDQPALIDLIDVEYVTVDGLWHQVDEVIDGRYHMPPPPAPPPVPPPAPPPEIVPAAVDVDPDTLNLRSGGKLVTCYIELSEEYNPEHIDATTILLNETISPVLDPRYDFVTNSSEYLVDHNEDGILERMVKFDRAEVMALLSVGEATLTITGKVNDTTFEGSDTIRVISKGK